jgi:hypothetical protein
MHLKPDNHNNQKFSFKITVRAAIRAIKSELFPLVYMSDIKQIVSALFSFDLIAFRKIS